MNPLIRWGKFNLVGAMGMVVQLAALALFNRVSAGHYLYATAAAIELALIHNFVWHLHYTWRDRRDRTALLTQFIRFHLSNGLVSMLGNLVLMRILLMRHAYRCLFQIASRFCAVPLSTPVWEITGHSQLERGQTRTRRR